MDSHVEYDPEYREELRTKTDNQKSTQASQRVIEWRKRNPEKYRTYQREYMKRYKARSRSKKKQANN